MIEKSLLKHTLGHRAAGFCTARGGAGAGTILMPSRIFPPVKALYAVSALVALGGCAGPRPMLPAPYTVMISADTSINLDRQGRATPVQVSLFELKNSSSFESIDFYTLFEKGEQALGSDVVAKEQLVLQPGQTMTLARKAKSDARMLGVFVAFRSVEKSAWRAVAPLPQAKEVGRFALFSPSFETAVVTVRVGTQGVTAEATGAEVPIPVPGSGGLPQIRSAPLSLPIPSISLPGAR